VSHVTVRQHRACVNLSVISGVTRGWIQKGWLGREEGEVWEERGEYLPSYKQKVLGGGGWVPVLRKNDFFGHYSVF